MVAKPPVTGGRSSAHNVDSRFPSYVLLVLSSGGFSELTLIEVGINPRLYQESRVGAALDDTPVLYDKNLVCLEDSGKAVGDDNRGAAGKSRFERPLDRVFGFGIEMGGGLVEDDNVRRL